MQVVLPEIAAWMPGFWVLDFGLEFSSNPHILKFPRPYLYPSQLIHMDSLTECSGPSVREMEKGWAGIGVRSLVFRALREWT